MRAITVRQPWAWAIIHAGKGIENRSRNIAGGYRGPVAIHAGLAPFEQHNMASRALRAAHGTETPTLLAFGAVIGVVDLVQVHRAGISDPGYLCDPWDGCSPWAEPTGHHLVLANPRPLARPIRWRGALGLWTVPDDLETAIREQVPL